MQNISTVFQDFYRYRLSLRENIGFGNLDFLYEDDKLVAALEKAGADSILNLFEDNLDKSLNFEMDNGVNLSGGLWQRLALARALLRDAPLVILDEPSSALDPQAEVSLYNEFAELMNGKTCIMISHRLGFTHLADKILLLNEGKILEFGTFNELMNRNGAFAQLYLQQVEMYQAKEKTLPLYHYRYIPWSRPFNLFANTLY